MPAEITLFYAPGACSLAPHIALEETGSPFRATAIDTKGGEQRRPAYLKINPKARVPALLVDDWALTENPAILQFIARSFPEARLWPEGPRDAARATEWMAWLSSTIHVAYAHMRRAERYANTEPALEEVRAKGRESCDALWPAIERAFGDGPWALGDAYSVVDAYLMVFWTWGHGPGLRFDMHRTCPKWTAQAIRMASRPAVQRAFRREALDLPR